MSIRTSDSACNNKMQRKRPACESFIDERSCKYTKTMNNLDPQSTSPTDRPIDLPSKGPRKPARKARSAPCGDHSCYREPDFGNSKASPERYNDLFRTNEDLIQARGRCTQVQGYSPDLNPPDTIRLPLSRRALRDFNRLNQSASYEPSSSMSPKTGSSKSSKDSGEPNGAVNAEHPSYLTGLDQRGIYFADDEPDKDPSNIQALKKAISAKRSNYIAPDNTAARELRIRARQAPNESAIVQSVLPMIAPIGELEMDGDISTTPDQRWHRTVMIRPDEPQMLTAPKPDRTIGWSARVFSSKYLKAMRLLGHTIAPVAGNSRLTIPLFTIEMKGGKGVIDVARLQNLHNGATMLANLFEIWKLNLEENGFFNKVHAMSLELTKESIQLSCYWARKSDRGIEFYGRALYGWNLYDGHLYKKAHRYIRNALEWVREQAFKWVCQALSALEDKLNIKWLPPKNPRTPAIHASSKRTRSVTSVSSTASNPVKKKGVTKMRKALSGGKGEAGEEERRKEEASEDGASKDEVKSLSEIS